MKKISVIVVLILGISASLVYAHSGRTDKNGCHKDKKTDTTHCH